MTTRNFYETIAANETLPTELREFATTAIERMNKSAEKAAEKKSAEDAPIIEAITNYLHENPGAHTASDIAAAVGIKTPKATAVLRKVEGVNVGKGEKNKRIVKTYSL